MTKTRKNPVLIIIAVVAILLASLFLACDKKAETKPSKTAEQPKTPTNSTTTQTKPATPGQILVKDLDGNEHDLDDFGGNVAIVDLWTTWCGPCKREMPIFQQLHDKYKDDGLTILAISVDRGKTIKDVRPYIEKSGFTFPVALVTKDVFKKFEPPQSIPTTYVIDRKGKIRNKIVGIHDYDSWVSEITPLLNETLGE